MLNSKVYTLTPSFV